MRGFLVIEVWCFIDSSHAKALSEGQSVLGRKDVGGRACFACPPAHIPNTQKNVIPIPQSGKGISS